MGLGNHGPGSPFGRSRRAFSPEGEMLEGRRLMTGTLDLATTETTPYGVEMVGQDTTANAAVKGAGYNVTDVGDVTKGVGGGYDAFVISAPGLTTPTLSGTPTFVGTSTAYLVLGSDAVGTSTAVPYNSLSSVPLTQANQRAGDLGQLGKGTDLANPAYQVNPTVTQPTTPGAVPFAGYNYNGLTFTTSGTPNSGLGFSVAALGNIDGSGYDSFAIGAPNAANGGRVYIIYGSAALATLAAAPIGTNKVIDLDNGTLQTDGVKEVILNDTTAGGTSEFGYSVAGLGNYFNYGLSADKDIAIGVPGASLAFAISGLAIQSLPSSATPVDLATLTTTNKIGIEYMGTGITGIGSSVATGLDFDGAVTTAGNFAIDDLVIGSAATNTAYLVYGDQQKSHSANGIFDNTLGTIQDLAEISQVPPVTGAASYPLEGLVFQGGTIALGSSLFGFSASTAGDFNGDGINDIIIGAPSTNGITGSASIIYGVPEFTVPSASLSTTHLVGVYTPGAAITVASTTGLTVPINLTFQDQAATADDAGFSVSYIGDIPGEGINGVLIGAPLTNSGAGQAYVIPGNYESPNTTNTATFPKLVSLSTAITSLTYAGFGLVTSNSANGAGSAFLGTSVSGRTPLIPITGNNSQQFSVDRDNIPDVFVGAPGFSLANPANAAQVARPQAGIVYALEGSLLGAKIPNNVILTGAGVNSNVQGANYTLSATGASKFYIFSSLATATLPAFDPTVDLTSPITLIINGITFPNVTLIAGKDSAGANDVSFNLTAAQVTSLGLVAGSTISITIRGNTNANPSRVFVAKATTVGVTAAATGAGGGGGASIIGPTAATILTPPLFTGDLAGLPNPPVTSLERKDSYQPIPVQLAYEQFLPAQGFEARSEVYHHPEKGKTSHQFQAGTILNVSAIHHSENRYSKVNTLLHHVFDRGKFKIGRETTFTHKGQVIPRIEKTQSFPG